MPELPEVEAVCRKLNEAGILGKRILRAHFQRPAIAWPQIASEIEAAVEGRILRKIERRAKNLLLYLSGDFVLRVHLRMTGNLLMIPDARLAPANTRVSFEFARHRALIFHDPRALGRIHLHTTTELNEILAPLGPEPLSTEFTLDWLRRAAAQSRKPAKLFLMDQNSIAGLGNIYAAEALFRARVDPAKPMNRLSDKKVTALHASIVSVLTDAVQSACKAYSSPAQFGEAEAFSCFVYDREGDSCLICRRKVRRIRQGGRSTYYCPGCQT
jgi:formamidopyrimidine-DNA glycosylase